MTTTGDLSPHKCAQKCDHQPQTCKEFNGMASGCASTCSDAVKEEYLKDFNQHTKSNCKLDAAVHAAVALVAEEMTTTGDLSPHKCAQKCDHQPQTCKEFNEM